MRCSHCKYPITGLKQNVCPECGKPFHHIEKHLPERSAPVLSPRVAKLVLILLIASIISIAIVAVALGIHSFMIF